MSPWPRKHSFSFGIWAALLLSLTVGTARARSETPATQGDARPLAAASASRGAGLAYESPQVPAGFAVSDHAALGDRDEHVATERDGDEEEEPKHSLSNATSGLEHPAPRHCQGRSFAPIAAPVLRTRASARMPRGPPLRQG